MDKKGKTLRALSEETDLSSRSVHRATQDRTIGGCQRNTPARIGSARGAKTRRLYEEVNGDCPAEKE